MDGLGYDLESAEVEYLAPVEAPDPQCTVMRTLGKPGVGDGDLAASRGRRRCAGRTEGSRKVILRATQISCMEPLRWRQSESYLIYGQPQRRTGNGG